MILQLRAICLLATLWLSIATLIDPDLSQAKKVGLANSRYLKPTSTTLEASSDTNPNLDLFNRSIKHLLIKNCLECHGPKLSEGRLRIDQIEPNLQTANNSDQWREIYNALANNAMPPDDANDSKLSNADRQLIIDWISQELSKASLANRNKSTYSSFRRLTKYEFKNALEDLLNVSLPTSNRLPPEVASEEGFKNSSELLQMSAMQFETIREIALDALQRALPLGDQPPTVHYRALMSELIGKPPKRKKDELFDKTDKDYEKKRLSRVLLDRQNGQGIPFQEAALQPLDESEKNPHPQDSTDPITPLTSVVLVLPASNEIKFNLDRFLPDSGTMRVRIRAARSNNNPQQFASLRLIFSAHTSNDANFSQVISQRDIPVTANPDTPEIITFDIQLQDIQRNPFRKLTTTFPRRDEFLSIRNVSNVKGKEDPLCVLIDRIEIIAPFYEQWPPKSYRDVFLDKNLTNDSYADARKILERFLHKAWRRPISQTDIDPYIELLNVYRSELPSFQAAMVEVLATALASPEFLYITHRNTSNSISDYELANRLSFLLWSSIPDEPLLVLAQQGQLKDPKVLASQLDRMLADPRSKRFCENFVEQWLGTDGLDSVTHIKDPSLRDSMRQEPIAFFDEVLRTNSSVLDFIHSDYVVVDEAMAKHYGIPNVYGPDFRKVSLDPSVMRGGILTNAVVLAMNSDGKDSHPLKRGVWMLRRILQDPPPPPPPNVPQVDLTDPEILKMSLKERIEDHRNKPACFSCHAKIDPWGIAFENYDAFGKYRTAINDRSVDAKSLLYNKQELAGIQGLKEYLLENRQDQLCRAFVDKIMTYGLGRPMSFADREPIDRIAIEWRKTGDGLQDLIRLVVASELFHSK
ncbi:MAG: DUF1592 domain-containing protein [Planctomycetaceae bacterium]|jgi:hypothetical protein|nr:DUF1592 domain-containing protein [Planctomycetaceae bacterium]MCE2815037.1 DUF1592 domain-containing protein [Planctomycetaceae bacterium]